jgi:hypothetical protein
VAKDSLIGWVPSIRRTDDEGIEEYIISLSIVVLRQGGIFLLLLLSVRQHTKYEYVFSNGMVTSMTATVLQVSLTATNSSRRDPSKARYRLVDSDGG